MPEMNPSTLYSLIYSSRATNFMSEYELTELASQAAAKNQQLSITGFMQYKNGFFLQYLEGEESQVLSLMDTIARDHRHTVTRVIRLPNQPNPRFEEWYMRYLSQKEFGTIGLIDLIENIIMKMNNFAFEKKYIQANISRLIDQVSEYHHKYGTLF